MEGVGPLAQEVRTASPNHDRVALKGNLVHSLLHHQHHAVGIEDLAAESGGIALVTAAPEGLGQSVKSAVHPLIAAHDRGRLDVGEAGNFLGDQVIPDLPAQVFTQLGGDSAPAAAVLALNGNEAKHFAVVYCDSATGL